MGATRRSQRGGRVGSRGSGHFLAETGRSVLGGSNAVIVADSKCAGGSAVRRGRLRHRRSIRAEDIVKSLVSRPTAGWTAIDAAMAVAAVKMVSKC